MLKVGHITVAIDGTLVMANPSTAYNLKRLKQADLVREQGGRNGMNRSRTSVLFHWTLDVEFPRKPGQTEWPSAEGNGCPVPQVLC